jgi:SP family sugar:H+ symporter-like MFS transporter
MLGQKSFKVNGADCGLETLVLGITTSMGGFLFGYDTGQISGLLIFSDFRNRFAQIEQDEGPKKWDPIYQSTLVSLMSIGCMIGALFGS